MDESSTFCWIETDRVRLLSWKESDAEKFQQISSDPEVMRYINGGRPWSSGELDEFIGRQMRHAESRGFCLWRMVGKIDGETIGFCGLQPLEIGGRSEVEIGWWLARVVAIAMPENLASRRIMDKIGMRYESETEHKGFLVVLYAAECQ
jgi:RimJ/RimL family protein N-acetyltransferase